VVTLVTSISILRHSSFLSRKRGKIG
jgi:hypothetical protein